jgi:small subunit ribosomal protein S7
MFETLNQEKYHLISKFVNLMMIDGKKSKSEKLVFKLLKFLHSKTKKSPVHVFCEAIENISPVVTVQSVRVRRRVYQVPFPLSRSKQLISGMKWIIQYCRKNNSTSISEKLNQEILLAYQNKGELIKKKTEVYKLAKTNRPFAHYRWF